MQVPSLENKGGGANHTESLNSIQAISQHSNSITVFGKLYSVFLNPVANSANICTTEQCQSQARRKQVGAANDLCYRRTVSLVWNCFYKAQQLGINNYSRQTWGGRSLVLLFGAVKCFPWNDPSLVRLSLATEIPYRAINQVVTEWPAAAMRCRLQRTRAACMDLCAEG